MEKQTNQEIPQASKLIDDTGIVPVNPRRPASYDHLKKHDPEHRLVKEYDEAKDKYESYYAASKADLKPPEKVVLKKLVDIDYLDLYRLFKEKFFEIHLKPFNPDINAGEAKILVFTLLYYFFRSPKFLNSPLINKEINTPMLSKGICVFGGYGCGKTSVFKTINKLFFDAEKFPYTQVKDADGDMVELRRYRRKFTYFTANESVEMYEACLNQEEKERFWRMMNAENLYIDDLMTERKASNYGTVEIFKDILEGRYAKQKNTLCSLNYDGTTLETLQKMGLRYGPRVYDRSFEMYNFIELKGKSLRK